MKNFFFSLLLIFQPFIFGEEKQYLSRINSFFIIHDASLALDECERALKDYPDSLELKKCYIRALAETGNESKAIQKWKEISSQIEDPKDLQAMHEIIAWGVLMRGKNSQQLIMKNISLIGAFFTHDAKAVDMILSAMQSSNAMMRALAVKLACEYGDSMLKEEVVSLLEKEKIHFVRAEVIKAIGALRIVEAGDALKEILCDKKATAEEKFMALQSLALMYDHIDEGEIERLLKNKRAGFRMLAAEVVARLGLKENIPLLVSHLNDSNPDVRMTILNTIGLLGVGSLSNTEKKIVADLCQDSHSHVAITASFVALLSDQKQGEIILRQKMQSEDPKVRRLAAAAAAFVGKKGLSLALEQMRESKDPYVAANLACSLLTLRVHTKEACDLLFQFLDQTKNQHLMWEKEINPLLSVLSPSDVNFVPHIPNLPSLMDGMTRLSLLNALAMIQNDRATLATKEFLRNSLWGLTATAAVILLEEGEMQSLEVVKQLLYDGDEKIRLQSALALAFIGGDESAVTILEESYYQMDRDIKLHILEAIGRIGSKQSIPFLLKVLDEPFQTLRIAAASALIQIIYH